jgi:hypothetical protein
MPESMAEASAAISEILESSDPARAYHEILEERRERALLFDGDSKVRIRGGQSYSAIGCIFSLFAFLIAAVFWCISRLIAAIGWIFYGCARLLIWTLSRVGLLARRSVSFAANTGREKVIPWIGARDWKSMAIGCRVQIISAARRVDNLLAWASGNDRLLHLILRFATAAGATIGIGAVLFSIF